MHPRVIHDAEAIANRLRARGVKLGFIRSGWNPQVTRVGWNPRCCASPLIVGARLSRVLEILQHLLVVPFGFYFLEHVLDLSVCADDEGRARGAHVLLAVHALLLPR